MGVDATEVQSIADEAARRGAFVSVPLSQRYQPFAIRARELLAAGRLGPLSHIYIRLNRPGPARYPAWDSPWMLDPTEAGGGCLRNLGPHGFDMFLHLTGEEAQVTGAQIIRLNTPQRPPVQEPLRPRASNGHGRELTSYEMLYALLHSNRTPALVKRRLKPMEAKLEDGDVEEEALEELRSLFKRYVVVSAGA